MSNGMSNNFYETDEYKEKIRSRAQLIKKCHDDYFTRANTLEACNQDPVFFIENFLWLYDPRPDKEPHHFPAVLYPFQEDYVRWLVDHILQEQDALVEKSRDMGATWLTLATLFWMWLFSDVFSALIGSRKQEFVDNKSLDSHFGKFDYMIENLPRWMLPKNFKKRKHRNFMKLINPENHNTIRGESANQNFATGGRYSVIFFDEFAKWQYAENAWTSAAQASPSRLAVSTPFGKNKFARIRFDRENPIDTMTLHWRLHPMKDDEWYESQKDRMNAQEVAQELDISYEGSVRGKVYPEWKDVKWDTFQYDPNLPLYVSWDFGRTDDTFMIWWQKRGDDVFLLDCYWNNGKTIDFYVPFVVGYINSENIYGYTEEEKMMINEHKQWKKGIHFGDPAGKQRNQVTNTSVIKELGNYGIHVNTNTKAVDFENRKTKSKNLMKRLTVNKNKRTEYLSDCMHNSRYPERSENSQATTAPKKPVHNWACLSGETEIRTLSGWVPIEELEGEEDFYVWSFSKEHGRLIPALAERCWKTHEKAPLVEVGLDSGVTLRATPEHLFMMRDGSWKSAEDLEKGDSLMPFYEHNNRGYVRVNLNDGSKADEHRYIFSYFSDSVIDEDVHIHHIDGDKRNNNPDNLKPVTPQKHCSITFSGLPNSKRRLIGSSKGYETKYSRSTIIRDCPNCGEEFTGDHKTFYCRKSCQQKAHNKRNSKRCSCGNRMARHAKRCIDCYQETVNHKVRFVKKSTSEPVYDISVPETNNFVANGVVVHNSHGRSAFEYFAVNEPNYGRREIYDTIINRKKSSDKTSQIAY